MRVALVYVNPNLQHEKYVPAARRWTRTYLDHPPGQTAHDVHVVITGDKPTRWPRELFDPLPVTFHHASNYAKDLGAFMLAAERVDCDLLVCLGAHVNFHRGGWLDRIVEILERSGPTLCGPWGFSVPTPHLRTTLFACPPKLLTEYPYGLAQRYQFEHGKDNFSLWSRRVGFEPWQITWDAVIGLEEWRPATLTEALARDQHTLRDFGE